MSWRRERKRHATHPGSESIAPESTRRVRSVPKCKGRSSRGCGASQNHEIERAGLFGGSGARGGRIDAPGFSPFQPRRSPRAAYPRARGVGEETAGGGGAHAEAMPEVEDCAVLTVAAKREVEGCAALTLAAQGRRTTAARASVTCATNRAARAMRSGMRARAPARECAGQYRSLPPEGRVAAARLEGIPSA